MASTLELVTDHILTHLHPKSADGKRSPLVVALQGPQGSGKTFVAKQIHDRLTGPLHSLRVAILSIDDLYLPYPELCALAETDDPLLYGRGLPGTHDVRLGLAILSQLKAISEDEEVTIPIFDKSLHDGWGDRAANGIGVHGPLDVVIFEGWCIGFSPIPPKELHETWETEWKLEVQRLCIQERGSLAQLDVKHVEKANEMLEGYIPLWDQCDIFVQVSSRWYDCQIAAD